MLKLTIRSNPPDNIFSRVGKNENLYFKPVELKLFYKYVCCLFEYLCIKVVTH